MTVPSVKRTPSEKARYIARTNNNTLNKSMHMYAQEAYVWMQEVPYISNVGRLMSVVDNCT